MSVWDSMMVKINAMNYVLTTLTTSLSDLTKDVQSLSATSVPATQPPPANLPSSAQSNLPEQQISSIIDDNQSPDTRPVVSSNDDQRMDQVMLRPVGVFNDARTRVMRERSRQVGASSSSSSSRHMLECSKCRKVYISRQAFRKHNETNCGRNKLGCKTCHKTYLYQNYLSFLYMDLLYDHNYF